MNTFNSLNYGAGIMINKLPIDDNFQLHIRLEKAFCDSTQCDQYFIKIYLVGNRQYKVIGYIYFYLNPLCEEGRISTFIGTYINPKYRSCGLASLLLSYWISLTRENDYDNLSTIKKQRKPFVLYLLKKYKFDITDTNEYLIADDNIYICTKPNDATKYLLFQDPKQRLSFTSGKVYRHDCYQAILTSFEDKPSDVTIIDNVLLSRIHILTDFDESYNLAQKKMQKVKEEGIQIIGANK